MSLILRLSEHTHAGFNSAGSMYWQVAMQLSLGILNTSKLPYLQCIPVPDMYDLYWRHRQAQATLLSRGRVCAPSVSMLGELQISVCQHHTHVPLGYCSTQPDRVWHEQMMRQLMMLPACAQRW